MDFSNPTTASSIGTVNVRQLHVYCEIKQISNCADVFENWDF